MRHTSAVATPREPLATKKDESNIDHLVRGVMMHEAS